MKGSGWVALGILVIFILGMLFRIFYQDAMGYKLKHQSIVFGELDVLRVKNTLALSEKSLFVTWGLSAAREIFDAGATGFGREYWRKINPADKSDVDIPSDADVKTFMETDIKTFRGLGGTENLDGISLFIGVTPAFTIEDTEFTTRISGVLKTYIGREGTPSTESRTNVDYTYEFDIRFRALAGSGRVFVDRLKALSLPYFGDANTYVEDAKDKLSNAFPGSAISGIKEKEFKIEKAELLVPTAAESGILDPLGGLIFHYDVSATFEDITEPEKQYYYLDENVYEKRPFPLKVKAEDYLVALNCAAGGLHTFSSADDVLCSGQIYTCNTYIQGITVDNWKGCAGRAGEYACGGDGFKTQRPEYYEYQDCYCRGFGGTMKTINWVCPETTVSDAPLDGWSCTPFEEEVPIECPPGTKPPPGGCTETVTRYSCTRNVRGECTECTLGPKGDRDICNVPAGCTEV